MDPDSGSIENGMFIKPREKRIDAANTAAFKSRSLDLVVQGHEKLM